VQWEVPAGAAVEVRGASAVDVPAGGQREYRLTVVPHTEGDFDVPVTLTAARTGEFSRRIVRVKAGPAAMLETVTLEGLVRQTARRTVAVVNPFAGLPTGPDSITFDEPVCSRGDVRVTWVRRPSASERDGALAIDYRPNAPTASATAGGAAATTSAVSPRASHAFEEAEVVLKSAELGTFRYQLRLRAVPAGAAAPMRFRAALGAWQKHTFTFSHFEQAAASYAATIEGAGAGAFVVGDAAEDPATAAAASSASSAAAAISAPAASSWEGVRVTVPIAFVPSAVGKSPAELILRAASGAEHRVRLSGTGEPPAPAGPFYCEPGASIQLPFRNPFAEARDFTAASDSPHLTVDADIGSIGGRNTATVSVECNEAASGAQVAMGKVVVTCVSEPHLPPWVFYVRGEAAPPGAEGGADGAAASKKSKGKKKK
jgi:hydrocephalus-inducing protein